MSRAAARRDTVGARSAALTSPRSSSSTFRSSTTGSFGVSPSNADDVTDDTDDGSLATLLQTELDMVRASVRGGGGWWGGILLDFDNILQNKRRRTEMRNIARLACFLRKLET